MRASPTHSPLLTPNATRGNDKRRSKRDQRVFAWLPGDTQRQFNAASRRHAMSWDAGIKTRFIQQL